MNDRVGIIEKNLGDLAGAVQPGPKPDAICLQTREIDLDALMFGELTNMHSLLV